MADEFASEWVEEGRVLGATFQAVRLRTGLGGGLPFRTANVEDAV